MNCKRVSVSLASLATGACLLLGLPLAGVLATGHDLRQYLEFPPLTRYVRHAGFSWPAFAVMGTLALLLCAPFAWSARRSQPVPASARPAAVPPDGAFPAWGWAAVAAGAGAWLLAWTRFRWFAALQPYTFIPLWLAYVVAVNALTQRRTGGCMLTRDTGRFLALFPLSAAFWWFFEYLNRFVQNWYYVGVEDFTPARYVLFATLSFATVLPAVLGTAELLSSFPGLGRRLASGAPVHLRHPRAVAAAALALTGFGLAGIGVWPDVLFPLLWVSPLCIALALQTLAGRRTLLADLVEGNWRGIFLLALSALICGGFWEMWNSLSFAKWIYTVPYVNRFHIFEMPLLGYAGYLPFGLECAVIADLLGAGRPGPAGGNSRSGRQGESR